MRNGDFSAGDGRQRCAWLEAFRKKRPRTGLSGSSLIFIVGSALFRAA